MISSSSRRALYHVGGRFTRADPRGKEDVEGMSAKGS